MGVDLKVENVDDLGGDKGDSISGSAGVQSGEDETGGDIGDSWLSFVTVKFEKHSGGDIGDSMSGSAGVRGEAGDTGDSAGGEAGDSVGGDTGESIGEGGELAGKDIGELGRDRDKGSVPACSNISDAGNGGG